MASANFSVDIPLKAELLSTLGYAIFEKHTTDGAASPISATTANQLKAKLDEAAAQLTLQGNLHKEKERLNEERNKLLGLQKSQKTSTEGTALFYLTSIRNFLLGHFRGTERKLGDYGFTVNSSKLTVKVIIPRNPEKLAQLVGKVLEKHTEDGASSILAVFDMGALASLHTAAAQKITAAAKASRDKEKATEASTLALGTAKGQRTKTPDTISFYVRAIRDILLGIYRGREQSLGDWGYTVNFNTKVGS